MSTAFNHVVLMPWLSLRSGDVIRYGDVSVRPWEDMRADVTDAPVRDQLDQLVAMYHSSPSSEWGGQQRGVGIVIVGAATFQPLSEPQREKVRAFRALAFLASLAKTVHHSGPNAGHYILTAENFELVFQNFYPGQDRITDQSGILLRMTNIGGRIATTRFVKPSFVPNPMRVDVDEALLASLESMPRGHRRLEQRILRAASTYCESYHNTPALDAHARILLQASAFEILLNLPQQAPRLAFKNRVEALLASPRDRRYSCVYRVRGESFRDKRTVFGLWADHFYQLRNGIVHGDSLGPQDYRFRGGEHHAVASQHIFIGCVKQLINEAFRKVGRTPPHGDRVFWGKSIGDDDDAPVGFRTEKDWGALLYGGRAAT